MSIDSSSKTSERSITIGAPQPFEFQGVRNVRS